MASTGPGPSVPSWCGRRSVYSQRQPTPPNDSRRRPEQAREYRRWPGNCYGQNSNIWFTTKTGDDEERHYPVGRTIDRFAAAGGPGLLLLHAPGNTFIRDLGPGEQMLVQPGSLVYKDMSVRMYLHFEYPGGRYWFSSARYQCKTTWLTLTGPGRASPARSDARHDAP